MSRRSRRRRARRGHILRRRAHAVRAIHTHDQLARGRGVELHRLGERVEPRGEGASAPFMHFTWSDDAPSSGLDESVNGCHLSGEIEGTLRKTYRPAAWWTRRAA